MAIDLTWVQAAVIDRLVARNVAGGRVYDDVDFDTTTGAGTYVEVSFGLDVYEDTSGEDDNSRHGLTFFLTLDVFNEQPGFKPIYQTVAAIRAALNRLEFMAGETHCISWVDGVTYLKMDDGATRHGVVRLRISCRN